MARLRIVSVLCTCFVMYSLVNMVVCRRNSNKYTDPDDTTQSEGGMSFSRSDIVRLKHLLKKLPTVNSQLSTFHELLKQADGDLYLDMNSIVPDLDHLKASILMDPAVRARFLQAVSDTQYVAGDVEPWSEEDENLDPEDIPEEVADRNQTQGWEGCRVDYDMVVKPDTEDLRTQLIVWWNEHVDLVDVPNNPIDLIAIPIPELVLKNPVALPLIDAHGRRPTGVFEGNLHWHGTVEECHDTGVRWYYTDNSTGVPVTEKREFIGKYARLDLPMVSVNITITSVNGSLNDLSYPLVWPFAIGVCVPDTCSDDDIVHYATQYNQFLMTFLTGGAFDRNITWIYTGQHTDLPNDVPAQVVVGILLTFIIICLIAGCYDGWGRHRIIKNKIFDETRGIRPGGEVTSHDVKTGQNYLYGKPTMGERCEAAFVGFSFYSNFRHIFSSEVQSSPDWQVPSLDGVKGISFLWALSGLTYVFGPVYFECYTTANLIGAAGRAVKDWRMMPTFCVYYANYSFLYVGGFLCVHMWYKSYAANGNKLSVGLVLRYFLHRWWSIVPTGMALVMLFAWYYRYLGDGPFTSPSVGDAENCKESWWMILTLFNNIFNLDKQCFGWAWIYSVLWQLHVVSVFVVVPLVIKPVVGYVMLALMYIAHAVTLGIWLERAYEGELSWYFDVLQTPWCNAGPFCIGMMFAIIHHKHDKERRWHGALVFLLWMCALTGVYGTIYVLWIKFNPDNTGEWSKGGELAYDFMTPQILALSVGWIVFACEKGYGGIAGSLLRWKFWTFASKMMLPFTIFMAPIVTSYFTSMLVSFYIHINTISYVFYGHMIAVFLYGSAIALLFTYPLSRGVIAAVRSETRLQLFLYGCYPEGLEKFTGDLEHDRKIWEKEERREKKREIKEEVRQIDGLVGYVPHDGKPIRVYHGVPPDGGVSYRASTIYDQVKVDPNEVTPSWDDTPPPQYGHTNNAFVDDVNKVSPYEGLADDLRKINPYEGMVVENDTSF